MSVGVVVLDDVALDLHRRGQLAGLDREVVVEQLPLLDGLPAVELRVELVDVAACTIFLTCVGARRSRRSRRPTPFSLAQSAIASGSRVISATHEVALVAEHHELAGVGADRLELRLDRRRGDVLAAGGLEQLLDPAGDRRKPVGVDRALVAGAQPAVLGERLRGLLGQVVVAVHDAGALDQDLVALAERTSLPGNTGPTRADLVVVGEVDERARPTTRSGRSPRGSGCRRRGTTPRSPG